MAEINKINIKGVDYDIGGGGSNFNKKNIKIVLGDTGEISSVEIPSELVNGENDSLLITNSFDIYAKIVFSIEETEELLGEGIKCDVISDGAIVNPQLYFFVPIGLFNIIIDIKKQTGFTTTTIENIKNHALFLHKSSDATFSEDEGKFLGILLAGNNVFDTIYVNPASSGHAYSTNIYRKTQWNENFENWYINANNLYVDRFVFKGSSLTIVSSFEISNVATYSLLDLKLS